MDWGQCFVLSNILQSRNENIQGKRIPSACEFVHPDIVCASL